MAETNSQFPRSLEGVRESLGQQSGSNRALLLMAPLLAFELLVFVVPFFILLRISFAEESSDLVYAEGTWTLEAYSSVLTSDLLWSIVGFSFLLGVVVTVLSVLIGLFYAYAIWRSTGLVKSLLLFSVVLPLLTTLVIRTYAFNPLLAPSGTLNELLLSLGLISSPIQFVPGTVGVVVGQLYIVLPYAVLAIYSVLATMDWHVVEAARDLGASRPRSVLEVVVPQAMPGIIVAAVISFAWSVGAYAAPDLLSGNITFAMQVEGLMLSDMRYPLAAAFSVVMLLLMLASIAIMFTLLNRLGGEFELA
ncbi:ABC transporter permease [Natronococcus sp. A-GB1]|uniref:Binding-protein-dependent transport system inner membrane protein n=1 Tax=Natronococcus amylolyticus DSM 10524 TaxID=1227497 RepID=L9X0L8_9EURY|nr:MULTISPECIES: ABC transporter permease [Natronococcus]ELY55265.1 binding-protein-dependent transport system inner membrane protein [Natronococcus amylolyticus DSM 10524]MDG5761161.1 ABC transporter permease [Natronococcus sp. A-GB1]